jgi:hypothetical protein
MDIGGLFKEAFRSRGSSESPSKARIDVDNDYVDPVSGRHGVKVHIRFHEDESPTMRTFREAFEDAVNREGSSGRFGQSAGIENIGSGFFGSSDRVTGLRHVGVGEVREAADIPRDQRLHDSSVISGVNHFRTGSMPDLGSIESQVTRARELGVPSIVTGSGQEGGRSAAVYVPHGSELAQLTIDHPLSSSHIERRGIEHGGGRLITAYEDRRYNIGGLGFKGQTVTVTEYGTPHSAEIELRNLENEASMWAGNQRMALNDLNMEQSDLKTGQVAVSVSAEGYGGSFVISPGDRPNKVY